MPRPLITPRNQSTIAAVTALALAVVVVWWLAAGGVTDRVIEIDRAEPVPYSFMVDVNTADWPELAQLPGIGETLARRIVETRNARGGFRSQEDLLEVRGIGRVTLARISPHLLPLADDHAVAGN